MIQITDFSKGGYMNSKLNPYLNFKGNTCEAMEFYKNIFGGDMTMSTYGEDGMTKNPDENSKIMHAMLIAPNGITLMGADSPEGWEFVTGTNVSLSLSRDNDTELSAYFEKLSQGGLIQEPLKQAPWGDKFGIRWMVNITGKKKETNNMQNYMDCVYIFTIQPSIVLLTIGSFI